MEVKQEKVSEQFKRALFLILLVIWSFIQVITIVSVIALLYEGGFIGASILLYNLITFYAILTLGGLIIFVYLNFIEKELKRIKLKRKVEQDKFAKELKEAILKEMKNGTKK